MISEKEVRHIAKLARLELSEKEEIEKFRKEFSGILDYVEKLKKVDITGVKTESCFFEITKVTRKDKITKENKSLPERKKENQKLMNLVPEKHKDHLKIKPIL